MRSAQLRRPSTALPAGAKAQRGFSILEVMTSAFILVLVLTSSLIVLQDCFQAIDTARDMTVAGQILQSQMEKLRMLNWNQLGTASGYTTFTPDVGSSAQANLFTTAHCTQSITTASSYSTMKDIILSTTWTGTDGRNHTVYYYTRYCNGGISDFFHD